MNTDHLLPRHRFYLLDIFVSPALHSYHKMLPGYLLDTSALRCLWKKWRKKYIMPSYVNMAKLTVNLLNTRSYLRSKCRKNSGTENRIFFFFAVSALPYLWGVFLFVCLFFLILDTPYVCCFCIFLPQFPCHTPSTFSDSMGVNFAKQAFSGCCTLWSFVCGMQSIWIN